jgi:hypothetical protein
MDQILFLDEVHLFSSNMFFDAHAVHFTSTSNYVDPISYEDAMSRPDAKEWREAFDKEMKGLKKRNVFSVVDRPTDRNPLGTTMVYKDKIDHVKNTFTRKCRLCLRGDWQKEGADFFKYKTYSAYSTVEKIGLCTRLQLQIFGTYSHQTSLKRLPMAN